MARSAQKHRLTALVLLSTLGALGAPSCSSKEAITIELEDRCARGGGFSFREAGATAEVAVFAETCPSADAFAAGDTSGAIYRSISPTSGGPGEVGDLERKQYGFGVIVRDDQCAVIGFGCTIADLSSVTDVTITIAAFTNDSDHLCEPLQGVGCAEPTSCIDGRCVAEGAVPDATTDAPSDAPVEAGHGCTLSVLSSGALPAPLGSNPLLSGAAIAATSEGFVLAYREMTATGGSIHVHTLSVDGELGAGDDIDVDGCAATDQDDGIGLTFKDDHGWIAAALPKCTTPGGGTLIAEVDALGRLAGGSAARNPLFAQVTLAPHGALTPASSGSDHHLAYRFVAPNGDVSTQLARVTGTDFQGSLEALLPGREADRVSVAISPSLRAVLGRVPTGGHVLSLSPALLGDGGAPIDQVLPEAAWGSLATTGTAVFAVVGAAIAAPATDAGTPDAGDAGEGGAEAGTDDGGAPAGAGITLARGGAAGVSGTPLGVAGQATLSGEVMVLGSDVIVIAGRSGAIDAYRFANATSSLVPPTALSFANNVGATSISAFDGARLAAAAGNGRVAVVWLDDHSGSGALRAGGWALLQCTQ